MKRRTAAKTGGAAAVLALALALPVAVGGSVPVWQPLSDVPAPERQEVSYVALDGMTYLAAGNSRDQDRYDPDTGEWTAVEPLPAAFEDVDHVHGVVVSGKIVYIGGLREWDQPFPVSAAVAVYDPASGVTSGEDMPSPRAGGGVAAWNGMVIYAGGLSPGGSVARVDAYDPDADEWTRLEDMPRPRDHFQAAVVDESVYAVGGRTTDAGGATEDIAAVDALALPAEAADLDTATWDEGVTSLPTPRGGLGVAAVGDCIYAVGGEVSGDESVTGATEAYDTVGGAWHPLESLWAPRHGIQAATVGSTIYIAAGGENGFGYDPTSAHEALDVSGHAPCGVDEEPEEDPEEPGEPAGDSGQADGDAGASAGDPAAARAPLPFAPAGAPRHGLSIARLAMRPRLLRTRRRGPAARIVLSLSRPARALLRVRRARPGLRSGRRCRRVSRGARRPASRRCVVWVQRWHRASRRPVGRSVVRFSAMAHGSPLPAGRYRVVAVARDAGGARASARAGFRILR